MPDSEIMSVPGLPFTQIVHIVEDDRELREALGDLLDSFGLKYRSFESPARFLESLPLKAGGCLVLDIRMPGMSGLDLFREIHRLEMTLPVIVMTAHADVPVTIQAFRQGAAEFLLKPFAPQQFLMAVRAAMETDLQRQQQNAANESLNSRFSQLTEKDWEVIELLRHGFPNKRIAVELHISERAVEMRRSSLMKKVRVTTLSELIELITCHKLRNS